MGRLYSRFFGVTTNQEAPGGAIDGVNVNYALTAAPINPNSVVIALDGLIQINGPDYTLSGQQITMTEAPISGQKLFAYYTKAN